MCTRMRTYYSSEIGVDTYFVEMLMNSRNQLKKEKRKEKRKPREKLQKLTENRFERKSLGTSTLTEKCQTETFK